MTAIVDFAADLDWRFDPKSGRYRVVSGPGKGQWISRQAVLNLTKGRIALAQDDLVEMGRKLANGDITLERFQQLAAEELRFIHAQAAILGAGGYDRMTAKEWAVVKRNLKRQYYAGVDPDTGRKFGLKHLAAAIAAGTVTLPALLNRLRLYGNSAKESYFQTEQTTNLRAGRNWMVRRLDAEAEHCRQCPTYADRVMQVGNLPLPGEACDCRNNCKCSVLYLTVQEAIAMGASV